MDKSTHLSPMPQITPPTDETMKELKKISSKEFKKSTAYKKYVRPAIAADKKRKRESRRNWWKDNWIGIITLILTFLTLVATVLFGLLSMLR